MEKDVQRVIERIRNILRRDGGDITLVSVKDGVVKVRFQNACIGCPSLNYTLKNIVEKELKKEIPEIKKVESV